MTDYRDDREALNERVTTLQQELDGVRSDLDRERAKGTRDERVEALASELASAKERVAVMEIELRALRGNRAPSAGVVWRKNRAALIGAGGVLAGAAFFGVIRGGHTSVVQTLPSAATVTAATSTAATITPLSVAAPPPLSHPAVVPTFPRPAAAGAATARVVKATWPARVRFATGAAIAVGSGCTVEGSVVEQGPLPSLRGVSVRCGDRVIYDSTQQSAGMRQTNASVSQFIGAERGTLVFAANYSDTGTGDMPQLRIDGAKGTAFVWHDYPDAFRLELTMARASSPVTSEPLGTLGVAALDRGARVKQVRGRSGPSVGALCRLRAMPASERSCYVSVDCGAAGALFGGLPFSAMTNCNAAAVVAGNATILNLDDPNGSGETVDSGDPRLHLFTPRDRAPSDGARDVLTVADEPKNAAPWSVELIVEEPAAGAAATK